MFVYWYSRYIENKARLCMCWRRSHRQIGLRMGVGPLLCVTGKLPEVWIRLSFSPRHLFCCIKHQQLGHGSFHHMFMLDNTALVSP